MTIEYALSRSEVVSSFIKSVQASPRYRATILIYAIVTGVVAVLSLGKLSQPFSLAALIIFLAGGVGFLFFILIFLFIRAKTAMRSLTISQEGLSTRIGKLEGKVAWNKVRTVNESSSFVLIARTNGNAFFIPDRAFESADAKRIFVHQVRSWASTRG